MYFNLTKVKKINRNLLPNTPQSHSSRIHHFGNIFFLIMTFEFATDSVKISICAKCLGLQVMKTCT